MDYDNLLDYILEYFVVLFMNFCLCFVGKRNDNYLYFIIVLKKEIVIFNK